MAFVKTQAAAIAAAATQVEGSATGLPPRCGAAAPTTAVVPAASDEVSILQAGVFSTYGQLYQTVAPSPGDSPAVRERPPEPGLRVLPRRPRRPTRPGLAPTRCRTRHRRDVGRARRDRPDRRLADFINGVTSPLSGSFLTATLEPRQHPGRQLGIGRLRPHRYGRWWPADRAGRSRDRWRRPRRVGAGLAGDVGPAAAGGVGGAGAWRAPVLAGVGQGVDRCPVGAAQPGPVESPGGSAPVTLASQSWALPRRHRRNVAGSPACPRSPTAVAAARASERRATA